MKKVVSITLFIFLVSLLLFSAAQAQDSWGTIQGVVYQDVNGDGKCVNTGVAGEVPVENINVEFVSSDEKWAITHHTDVHGKYGLYAAGLSYWRVTARPSADWVVTSQNPLYAPVFEDSLAATDVNFCVQRTNTVLLTGSTAALILPVSGADHNNLTTIALSTGFLFVAVGLVMEWRRRQA